MTVFRPDAVRINPQNATRWRDIVAWFANESDAIAALARAIDYARPDELEFAA